jgi:hypothetical protein
MIELIKPSDDEIRRLARQEAGTRDAGKFVPICLGPWGNAALLLGIGVLAVIWVPFRVIARVAGPRRPHSGNAG